MQREMRARFGFAAALVVAAAAMRILPHPANFTPISAMALFGAARFDRKLWAFAVPLCAMLASDAVLELQFGWGFHALAPVVYASFALVVLMGFSLRHRRGIVPVGLSAVSASILFFVLTNLAVWATSSMYAKSVAGLITCYELALPFFARTLAGDLFYTGALFGAWALAERRFAWLQPRSLAAG